MKRRNHISRANDGFSLMELLIVVAIIGILMAMYMTTFSKVYRRIKTDTAQATMDQTAGAFKEMASEHPSVVDCRRDFFQKIGKNEFMCLLYYRVDNDAEFIAYWHTLLNPDSDVSPVYKGVYIEVTDPRGNTYRLEPHVMRWSFIAYRDGGVEPRPLGVDYHNPDTGRFDYMRYPSEFPATPIVAALSYQFLEEFDLLDKY
jgi:prepilin-type N-terminal cleavage/methylation domain-containing protein